MDCVAIGDEIAAGIATPLACETRTASSYTSSKITTIAGGKFHTYCIVSAGTYDAKSPKLVDNLGRIRNQSSCKVYVWIAPADAAAAKIVKTFATTSNDKSVTFTAGNDGIHPVSNTDLVNLIRNITGN